MYAVFGQPRDVPSIECISEPDDNFSLKDFVNLIGLAFDGNNYFAVCLCLGWLVGQVNKDVDKDTDGELCTLLIIPKLLIWS